MLKDPKVQALMKSIAEKGLEPSPSMPAGFQVVHADRRVKERRLLSTSKATGPNPKDIVGSTKAAMLLFPPIAMVHAVDAMMDGAGKYDPYNWRAKDITTSNYLHAAIRHVIDYWEGEECAPDSLAKHLGHAIATLGIVLDAQAHGCLIDDRPTSDGGAALAKALAQVAANEKWRREKRTAELAMIKDIIRKGAKEVLKAVGAKSGRVSGKKRNAANKAKVKQFSPAPRPLPAGGYFRRGI